MGNIFGTAFSTSGFSFDRNLSPNNQSFSAAVRAVMQQLGVATPFAGGGSFNGFGNPTVKVSTTATNGVATTALRSDSSPAIDQAMSPTWTGNHTFNPPSGTPLIVQLGNTTAFEVVGTASLAGRGPVAGALVDMTPDKGSFTVTYGGFVSNPVGTAWWSRNGNTVTLAIPWGTGSSNSANCSFNGLPVSILPTRNQWVVIVVKDNGTFNFGQAEVQPSGNVVFALGAGGANFTASGGKGIGVGADWMTFSYVLD